MLERVVCNNLRRKLSLVYLLNVFDWACTVGLLSTGRFYEANPLARTFIFNTSLGFLIKCIIPFFVVFLVNRWMYILSLKELRFADMLISFGLTVYLVVMLDHLINFVILLLF